MTIRWMPFPLLGTTFLPGRWFCTVDYGKRREALPMILKNDGTWAYTRGKRKLDNGVVTAIAFMPEPFKKHR